MNAQREMTLKEWVERLPEIHSARKEYERIIETLRDSQCTLGSLTFPLVKHLPYHARRGKEIIRNIKKILQNK